MLPRKAKPGAAPLKPGSNWNALKKVSPLFTSSVSQSTDMGRRQVLNPNAAVNVTAGNATALKKSKGKAPQRTLAFDEEQDDEEDFERGLPSASTSEVKGKSVSSHHAARREGVPIASILAGQGAAGGYQDGSVAPLPCAMLCIYA